MWTENMANNQADGTKAIAKAALEATPITLQVMTAAGSDSSSGVRNMPVSTEPELGRPTLKQPTFDRQNT